MQETLQQLLAQTLEDGVIKRRSIRGPKTYWRTKMKITKLLLLIPSACLLLSACHNQNKLLTGTRPSVAKFLMNAEISAQQKTHLYDSNNSVYLTCINNPKHFLTPFSREKHPCDNYFNAMLSYAKTYKGFENISLNQLKSKQVANRIKDVLINEEIESE